MNSQTINQIPISHDNQSINQSKTFARTPVADDHWRRTYK